ncbi:MAG: LysR substrate-binding domain-containing protein, partial [Pseudomonadota bacterium]
LLICVHHLSPSNQIIKKNGFFCVNVLHDNQSYISDTFAGRIKTIDGDKFSCADWQIGKSGSPILSDAMVNFDCQLKHSMQWGSHIIFIGELVDISMHDHYSALVYANRSYQRTLPLLPVNHLSSSASKESLNIGCFITIGPSYIPKISASFMRQFPDIDYAVFEHEQDVLIDQVKRGSLDAALLYNVDIPTSLYTKTLCQKYPYILLSKHHELSKKTKISLSELVNLPMVLLDIAPSRNYFINLFKQEKLVPKIGFRSKSFELVRGLVGQNLGYSILITDPKTEKTYDGSELVIRPIAEKIPQSAIVFTTKKQPHNHVINCFYDICKHIIVA